MDAVLSFQLNPWCIPTDAELSSWEHVLTERLTTEELHRRGYTNMALKKCLHIRDRYINGLEALNLLVSATAKAIQFVNLKGWQKGLLRRLVLQEDFQAGCSPVRHFRGLIPICAENPLLKIEVHISMLGAMIPTPFPILNKMFSSGRIFKQCAGDWLHAMSVWLNEVANLPSIGLPGIQWRSSSQNTSLETLRKHVFGNYARKQQLCKRVRLKASADTPRLFSCRDA
ncbi:hypothetical protein BDV96DRAFT_608242 [Lophiotrema nucula]|uniref:Uncharacterized protein n=1 Tax=Lophiotrema nucula TaxID=690887 RepID=A0A6A5YDQ3_9PLEO|nr:hypothetical protein BDV96DRAFT_608242 [Lophiotrema nucula]